MDWTGLILAAALAAPVPRTAPPPDPLGRGFMGVYPVQSTCVVERVEPNSPAHRIGLQPGDRFVKVGSYTPGDFDQLRAFVMDFRPGTRVVMEIQRRGKTVSKVIQLGTRTENIGSYPFPIEVEP
jgi:S1-C subfamily serine protease